MNIVIFIDNCSIFEFVRGLVVSSCVPTGSQPGWAVSRRIPAGAPPDLVSSRWFLAGFPPVSRPLPARVVFYEAATFYNSVDV